nr:protein LTO1 homolog [Aedes albopictus]
MINEPTPGTEVDINDVFDDLLLVEERLSDESYHRGLEAGAKQGNVDAYHFGYHRGAEIGAELGFYYGVVCAQEGCFVEGGELSKSEVLLKELKKEIEEFPTYNDLEVDLLERLLKLRNKYKKLCVLLKISAKYTKPNELSF